MSLFGLMLAGYAFGAAVAVLTTGGGVARRLVGTGAVVGGGAGLGLALEVFTTGAPFVLEVPALLSIADGLVFRLDALGAFFLGLVGLVAIPCAIYGVGYSAAYEGRYSLRLLGVMLNLFLLTMSLVPCAGNVLTFLLMWEGMSLTSYFLVVTETEAPDTILAGGWYLAMTHAGLALVLAAFLLLAAGAPTTAFGDLRAAASALSPQARNAVFLLALLGFGSKAGIIPLHVWLPRAHPAAPSHVSALLSGVMTKVGVYGFVRIVFDVAGDLSPWSGLVALTIGGVTAVLGVLYALMQHDLKRLLAYHTVENIGIIFIGLGLALAFRANGQDGVAALALTAALFHVFNHAIFKSLLFFGAGAVLAATGQRDMERLGGLIHVMPQTAIVFLIGCASISALPPLNGFVSEWLTFQAILLSPQLPQWGLKFAVPATGALLALAAALAAACFVKAYGVVFLSRPRSPEAAVAKEVDRFSLSAMFVLAALCVLAGVLPGFVIDGLGPVTSALTGATLPHQASMPWLSIVPIAESRSSYNGLVIFLFLTSSGLFGAAAAHRCKDALDITAAQIGRHPDTGLQPHDIH